MGDALKQMKKIANNSVDLIVTDPPYLIKNTTAGGNSELAQSIQGMNDEIREENLTEGYDPKILDEMVRVMKKINCYIWCNGAQIPFYFDYFVNKLGCSFDILIWNKTNAMPLYNNKYMTDKEYCLYFRKGAYCCPQCYEDAKTVFYQPINKRDKDLYGHPTIKPLKIIRTLIRNSSKKGDLICDPFMGSGTTGVAAKIENRSFVGIELSEKYFNAAKKRINSNENICVDNTNGCTQISLDVLLGGEIYDNNTEADMC